MRVNKTTQKPARDADSPLNDLESETESHHGPRLICNEASNLMTQNNTNPLKTRGKDSNDRHAPTPAVLITETGREIEAEHHTVNDETRLVAVYFGERSSGIDERIPVEQIETILQTPRAYDRHPATGDVNTHEIGKGDTVQTEAGTTAIVTGTRGNIRVVEPLTDRDTNVKTTVNKLTLKAKAFPSETHEDAFVVKEGATVTIDTDDDGKRWNVRFASQDHATMGRTNEALRTAVPVEDVTVVEPASGNGGGL